MAIAWKILFLGLILSISSVNGAGKCVVCDENTDAKCAATPQEIPSTDCTTDCFTLVDNNGKIKRGCVDDTNNKCDTENCKKCTSAADACNIKIPFTCKTCDSVKNANCSRIPSTFLNTICDDGINKCLVLIKDDKNIERRCVSKNDETCPQGSKCNICATTGCNKDIFPADRRRCYQCDSSEACGNPWANPAEVLSLPCTLYDENDKCFVYGTAENNMARGCASDTTFSKCTDAKEKCKQCSSNSCNSDGFKISQSIKCIQCKEQDEDCPWGYEDSSAKECVNQIEFWQSQGCYTKKIDGGKAERGCINDMPQASECTAANGCTQCDKENACNKADVEEFSCYKCRTDEEPLCSKKLTDNSFKSEKCRNTVKKDNRGCYTERWNDIVVRSCLVDADFSTAKNCLDPNYKMCTSCTEKNCNTLDAPGSAASAALASGLLGLALLFLRLL